MSALASLKSGAADALVITSPDRLARQMTQQEGCLAEVWKAGGKVFSLGDGGEVLEDDPEDPMRTAIRQMRGVFAQLERGLIRPRMAKGRSKRSDRRVATPAARRRTASSRTTRATWCRTLKCSTRSPGSGSFMPTPAA